MPKCLVTLFFFAGIEVSFAQVEYPYPLHAFALDIESQKTSMAYMDIKPAKANGKTVILFHGKNFNGYYWKDVIAALRDKGYRVLVPDQVGWGRSDKPNIHYSFHMLAHNNKLLLDSLRIQKVIVLGHSMGGMLACRFSLMYPRLVEKLVLENPIGLEDYKTFVPYQTLQQIWIREKAATYESYKKYQQSYYPEWKPEYEQYVKAQAESLNKPGFDSVAWVNALTYQMIYEQPVIYEMKNIEAPALLIIGQLDRTVVGKNLLEENEKARHGQYPALGKKLKMEMKRATLIEIDDAGHIPHIQVPGRFKNALFKFLDPI